MDGVADHDRPGIGLLLAGEHAEERRLAGAVGADDSDDAGPREREREIFDQQAVAESLAETVDLDDAVAESCSGRNHDLEFRRTAIGGFGLGVQLLVRRQPGLALGLASLGRHTHPFEFALEGATTVLVALLFAFEAITFLIEPTRVVALEREATASIEFEDPLGHVVEEVAVVGDGDDRAVILLQEPLEPVDALGVEVVGGFVEQQQVGSTEKEATQSDASPLTAGQRGDIGVVGRTAQRVHRDLDVALEAPGVGGGDLVLEFGLQSADLLVVGVGVTPHRHDLVVTIEHGLHGCDAVHHVAEDVLRRVELRFLGEIADRESGCETRFTRESVVEAGHDAQQARFSGTVRADHADLGAGVERQRDVLQHRAVGRIVAGQFVTGVNELVGHERSTFSRCSVSCRLVARGHRGSGHNR